MTLIPDYPDSAPVTLAMGQELKVLTSSLMDGHCELLFGSIYLYRNKYRYTISRITAHTYVLFGEDHRIPGKDFFSVFGEIPSIDAVLPLLACRPWKQFPASYHASLAGALEDSGFSVTEDRDNFDYLYLRRDLASLSGKRFHKKKNLVNAFNTAYPGAVVKELTGETAPDAQAVLDHWEATRGSGETTDYPQCTEALSNLGALGCGGVVVYVDARPVGFSLGESLARGTMYCTHFEKAIDDYKGVFQFVNNAQALALGETVEFINREQDVGDEGLRQAKETYRPVKFVVKYFVKKA